MLLELLLPIAPVVASQEQHTVSKIPFAYSYDVFLHGVLSNNLHNSIFLVVNRF